MCLLIHALFRLSTIINFQMTMRTGIVRLLDAWFNTEKYLRKLIKPLPKHFFCSAPSTQESFTHSHTAKRQDRQTDRQPESSFSLAPRLMDINSHFCRVTTLIIITWHAAWHNIEHRGWLAGWLRKRTKTRSPLLIKECPVSSELAQPSQWINTRRAF